MWFWILFACDEYGLTSEGLDTGILAADADANNFQAEAEAITHSPVIVCDIVSSLLSKTKCRIHLKLEQPETSHSLVGKTICGLEVG